MASERHVKKSSRGFPRSSIIASVMPSTTEIQKIYRVTHLLVEKVMLTSVPSQDNLGMNWS